MSPVQLRVGLIGYGTVGSAFATSFDERRGSLEQLTGAFGLTFSEDRLAGGLSGFLRRFAWPKVVAVRTLRHGADLALEATRGEQGT